MYIHTYLSYTPHTYTECLQLARVRAEEEARRFRRELFAADDTSQIDKDVRCVKFLSPFLYIVYVCVCILIVGCGASVGNYSRLMRHRSWIRTCGAYVLIYTYVCAYMYTYLFTYLFMQRFIYMCIRARIHNAGKPPISGRRRGRRRNRRGRQRNKNRQQQQQQQHSPLPLPLPHPPLFPPTCSSCHTMHHRRRRSPLLSRAPMGIWGRWRRHRWHWVRSIYMYVCIHNTYTNKDKRLSYNTHTHTRQTPLPQHMIPTTPASSPSAMRGIWRGAGGWQE